ncbi:MAG: ABC transporter permease subunit [Patescibacteria group bacterium]
MIGSISHPKTRSLHYAHSIRNRLAWLLMTLVIIGAVLFVETGYFTDVDWPILTDAVLQTTYRLIVAYGIALALGVGIGLLVGWSPLMDFLFPFFDVLQNLPSFALFPLFVYFFGFTDKMIVLFAVTSIVWPILFAVLTTIRSVHKDLNDAAIIFGATGFRRITHYLAPLSFPAVLSGSIVGIAIGWEAVIGAEIIISSEGFGAFIKGADASGLSPSAVAGALGILVIVFIVNRLVWAPLLSESSRRYAE